MKEGGRGGEKRENRREKKEGKKERRRRKREEEAISFEIDVFGSKKKKEREGKNRHGHFIRNCMCSVLRLVTH